MSVGASALLLAHAGHWLTAIGFALAPLTVIAAIALLALAESRRASREASDSPRPSRPSPTAPRPNGS